MAFKIAPCITKASLSPTMLPFLYKTKTLQDVVSIKYSSPSAPRRYASLPTPNKTVNYRPVILDAEQETNYDHPAPLTTEQPPAGPGHLRDSTITAEERDTFTRIFNDIIHTSEKGSPPFSPDDNTLPGAASHNERVKPGVSISSILAGAAKAGTPRTNYASFSPHEQEAPLVGRSERIRQAIARYPQPLRAAAARAMFVQQQQQEQTQAAGETEGVSEHVNDHVNFVRHRELMRVEDLLNAAKTDMDLWMIVEDKIFSLINKLNNELGEPVPKASKRGKKAAKGKKQVPKQGVEESRLETVAREEKVPFLSILGPNYPALLLVVARLFRHNFSSSPLALALLPAIKKHGPISYVLGASTALYNELIFLHWKMYGDFDKIDELLQDMDNGGVEFNQPTAELLRGIQKEKREIRLGGRGETLEALWKTQAMSTSLAALGKWKTVVNARLKEMEEVPPIDIAQMVDDDEDSLSIA